MPEQNIYDKIREEARAKQTPPTTIEERFGKPPVDNPFDKIRRVADEKRKAELARKQKNDEFFKRMKTDNLII